jgi:hypothetical protein
MVSAMRRALRWLGYGLLTWSAWRQPGSVTCNWLVRSWLSRSKRRASRARRSSRLHCRTDERHGEVIHRRYNHWVRLLDDAIRQQLALTSTAPAEEPVPPPAS